MRSVQYEQKESEAVSHVGIRGSALWTQGIAEARSSGRNVGVLEEKQESVEERRVKCKGRAGLGSCCEAGSFFFVTGAIGEL